MDKFYLILQDDGGFWIDGNEPTSEKYIVFTDWQKAFEAGMRHRNKGKA
jgi:hypothetical protein